MNELIGKRVLVKFRNAYKYLNTQEATVLEISPSGKYIKLMIREIDSVIWARYLKEVKILEIL